MEDLKRHFIDLYDEIANHPFSPFNDERRKELYALENEIAKELKGFSFYSPSETICSDNTNAPEKKYHCFVCGEEYKRDSVFKYLGEQYICLGCSWAKERKNKST